MNLFFKLWQAFTPVAIVVIGCGVVTDYLESSFIAVMWLLLLSLPFMQPSDK